MWAIWFSHELLPNHDHILRESLIFLLSVSENMEKWSSPHNLLFGIVKFMSDSTLQSMHQCWKMWLCKFNGKDKLEWMQKQRQLGCIGSGAGSLQYSIMHACISSTEQKTILDDFNRYNEKGCTFAEVAFDISVSYDKRMINPTLFERVDKYTLHYASQPYSCFNLSVSFIITDLEESVALSLKSRKIPVVKQRIFSKNPMLANCVQQFTLWVLSSASILVAKPENFTFQFHCLDALVLAIQLYHNCSLFDAIYTSNLADAFSPLSLVFSTIPLLKEEGFLITSIFLHKFFAKNLNDYLAICFGFYPNLLPALSGIRCIRQEGKNADTVAIRHEASYEHIVANMSINEHLYPGHGPGRHVRYLMWECLKLPFYNLEQLDSTSLQFKALYSCVKDCALSIFQKCTAGRMTRTNRCTQSAMLAVIAFSRIVQKSNGTVDYTFWDGFCKLLRDEKQLEPFLLHIQTQALYGNVHLHLIVTAYDCPLCTGTPLEQAFTKFAVNFTPLKHFMYRELQALNFIAYIHRKDIDLSKVPILPSHLSSGIHIIDSAGRFEKGGKIFMESILLSSAVKSMNLDDYSVTIMQFEPHPVKAGETFNVPINAIVFKLQDCLEPLAHFTCLPNAINHKDAIETSFGRIIQCSQSVNGDSFISIIAINDAVMTLFKNGNAFKPTKVSESSFKVSCLSHSIDLEYYVPVNYNEVKLQLSRKKQTLSIITPLSRYMFYDDRATFIKNPENKAVLLHKHIGRDLVFKFCRLQFIKEEDRIIKAQEAKNLPIPPLIETKRNIALIISSQKCFFQLVYHINDTLEVIGLIFVHSRIFDLELHTPAVDLSYFINENCVPLDIHVHSTWSEMKKNHKDEEFQIVCDAETVLVMKKVFQYFARRTKVSLYSKSQRCSSFNEIFTQAVVYPLYYEINHLEDDYKKHNLIAATYTHSGLNPVNTCTSSKISQEKDLHVPLSSEFKEFSIKEIPVCSGCNKSSISLKKCMRCKSVSYCSKTCQRKDWARHKDDCRC